jgi:hypothetical protein
LLMFHSQILCAPGGRLWGHSGCGGPSRYALQDGWWWAVVEEKAVWEQATHRGAASKCVQVKYFYDPSDVWEVDAQSGIRPASQVCPLGCLLKR